MRNRQVGRRICISLLILLCLFALGRNAWAVRLNDSFLERVPQIRTREGGAFSFAWIGDVQIQFSLFKQALHKMANDPDIAFLIVGGDMMDKAGEAGFTNFLRRIRGAPFPVVALPGNHDLWGDPDAVFFRRHIGDGVTHFRVGNGFFILLQNTSGNPPDEVERSFQELLAECAKSPDVRHLIIGMHVPPFDPRKNAPGHSMNASTERRFLAKLKPLATPKRSVTVMSAHVHGCFFRERDGVRVIVSGGGGGALYGKGAEFFHHYMKVSVRGGELVFTPVKLEKTQKK